MASIKYITAIIIASILINYYFIINLIMNAAIRNVFPADLARFVDLCDVKIA